LSGRDNRSPVDFTVFEFLRDRIVSERAIVGGTRVAGKNATVISNI
jgi:hypothetical protein